MTDLNIIQKKLRNLSALFELGEEAVPYLEETLRFIESIIPLIDEIHESLTDSAKQIPGAASQLSDVTKATELATNEILNIIDKGLRNCVQVQSAAETSKAEILRLKEVRSNLRNEIREAIPDSSSDVQKLLIDLWHQNDLLEKQLLSDIELQLLEVDDLKKRLNQIMMSLQVQDITTQQIASVSHVISTIRSRLSELQGRLGLETGQEAEKQLESGKTFDANARYDHSKSAVQQNEADFLIDEFKIGEGDPMASQNDIDRFFGS